MSRNFTLYSLCWAVDCFIFQKITQVLFLNAKYVEYWALCVVYFEHMYEM